MRISEPRCVALKRRGAKIIAKQLAGKLPHERLAFWRMQTEALRTKQAMASRKQKRA